jgi:hypothetical protein
VQPRIPGCRPSLDPANTPVNAYFALDPHYLEAPGEDYHSFRALAERSQLADTVKDAAVVTQVPELGPVGAPGEREEGWPQFKLGRFRTAQGGIRRRLGAGGLSAAGGLACRWHNNSLAVCQIP